jgi:hypothetical protein
MSCFRREDAVEEIVNKIDPTDGYFSHLYKFLQYVYTFHVIRVFLNCIEFLAQTIYQYKYFFLLVLLALIIFKAKLVQGIGQRFRNQNGDNNSVHFQVDHISDTTQEHQSINQTSTSKNEEKGFQNAQKNGLKKLMKNAVLLGIIGANQRLFDDVFKHYELFLTKMVQNVLRQSEVTTILKQIIESCLSKQGKRIQQSQQVRKESLPKMQSNQLNRSNSPLLSTSRIMVSRVLNLNDDSEHLLGLSSNQINF